MAYEVLITNEAFNDLDLITGFIASQSSIEIARRWFAEMIGSIETLREMPSRCPLAPEAEELECEVRLLLHGRKNRAYKIYFTIHQETALSGSVRVFHVRHRAMRPLDTEELKGLLN